MNAEIINLHSTAAAALIVESRAARIKAKIAMGDFAAALDVIQRLRHCPFGVGVSAFVRAEAARQANALMAELNAAKAEANKERA